MTSQSDTPFAEWLRQGAGSGYLDPEDVAKLRQKASGRLGQEVEQMRRRLAELEKDIAAINGVATDGSGADQVAEPGTESKTSVRQLVLRFVQDHPGSLAGLVVDGVLAIRPEVDAKYVHSELYKLSNERGPRILRKEGAKPHTRYFTRRVGNQS